MVWPTGSKRTASSIYRRYTTTITWRIFWPGVGYSLRPPVAAAWPGRYCTTIRSGQGDTYDNVRIDFTRLEGFWTADTNVNVNGGLIDGSCTGSNARTINTGQEGARFAGQCNQYWASGGGDNLTNVWFSYNTGFGPSYATADIMSEGGTSSVHNVRQASYQFIPGEGLAVGNYWEPQVSVQTSITGPTPSITGLHVIYPADTSPVTYTGFTNMQSGQDFYIRGTNANVTLQYNATYLTTCSGQNINLGTRHDLPPLLSVDQQWRDRDLRRGKPR